eukprot:gene5794-6075_t
MNGFLLYQRLNNAHPPLELSRASPIGFTYAPVPSLAPEQGSGSRRNILGLVAATATSALLGYMLPVQDLDTNAAKEIVLKREPRNFKRDFNGRVAVIGSDGTEYEIALDPRKRGVVLMHETNMDEFSHFNRGKTYSMQTRASQVDLQDDVVVDFFNSYSDWENRMVRVFDPELGWKTM